MADDDEDARSHKHKQTERLENDDVRHHLDDSIDEELLKTQHMSELSILEEEVAEEWDKMLGILILLLTLLGHASMGVAANIVPASSGFVQMAQRSGFVLMVSALPAYVEHQYFEDNIDWKELISLRSLSYSLFTNVLLMLWQATFFDAAQRTTQVQAYVLSHLQGPIIVVLNAIFGVMPLKTERSGLIFAVLGAIMVTLDPKALRVDGYEASNSVYVGLLMSSVFGAAYLLFNDKQTREFRFCFLVFYQSL